MVHRIAVVGALTLLLATPFAAQSSAPEGSLVSAVPRIIRFSGSIPGEFSAEINVRFALYKEQNGGEALWQETQTLQLDADGRYTALLGAQSTQGLPLALFSGGDARWLGVQPEGRAELPRVLLVSVPYALSAGSAESLGGKPLSAFILADSAAPLAQDGLHYQSGGSVSPAPQATSGAPGYLAMFTNSTDLGNSALYQSGGNVGFGTTSPAFNMQVISQTDPAALVIEGYGNVGVNFIGRRASGTLANPTAILIDSNLMTMQGRGYGASGFSGSSRVSMKFFSAESWTDTAQGTYISLATTPNGTVTNTERLRIDNTGNVGIGITAPAQRLSVAGVIQSTTGGFMFPDGSTQTVAATGSITSVMPATGGGLSGGGSSGAVTIGIASGGIVNAMVHDVAAGKITGTLPLSQVSGAAGTGANTFTGNQTITGGLSVSGTATVGGNLTLANGLQAPGAEETLRMLRTHCVNSSPAATLTCSGPSFSGARSATGSYTLTYATHFAAADTPAVSVTPSVTSGSASAWCTVNNSTNTQFGVNCFTITGATDVDFAVLVFGSR